MAIELIAESRELSDLGLRHVDGNGDHEPWDKAPKAAHSFERRSACGGGVFHSGGGKSHLSNTMLH